jgi:hypothetical protein
VTQEQQPIGDVTNEAAGAIPTPPAQEPASAEEPVRVTPEEQASLAFDTSEPSPAPGVAAAPAPAAEEASAVAAEPAAEVAAVATAPTPAPAAETAAVEAAEAEAADAAAAPTDAPAGDAAAATEPVADASDADAPTTEPAAPTPADETDLDAMVAAVAAADADVPEAGHLTAEAPAQPGAAEATPATVPAAAAAVPAVEKTALTPTWPFLVYLALWVAYGAAMVVLMRGAAAAGDLFGSQYYQLSLVIGFALVALGLIMIPIVWMAAAKGRTDRAGIFTSAFLKGAVSVFVGVAIWWVAYYVVVIAATSKAG